VGFEDALFNVGCHADTVITHRQMRQGMLVASLHPDFGRRAVRLGEGIGGVVHQVQQQLRQLVRVEFEIGEIGIQVHLDRDPLELLLYRYK